MPSCLNALNRHRGKASKRLPFNHLLHYGCNKGRGHVYGPYFVSYIRVSTDNQRRSGLGIEAQRAAVASYVAGFGAAPLAEFGVLGSFRSLAISCWWFGPGGGFSGSGRFRGNRGTSTRA
jgi:hypothetical protein